MATIRKSSTDTSKAAVNAADKTAKTTPKAETVKEVKVEPAKPATTIAAPAEKAPVKKAPAKKAPAKKATTAKKSTTAAKKECKTEIYVEYYGKQVAEKDMISEAKKVWAQISKKKVSDVKSITLYVKPEEDAVYFVINGTDAGRIDF